MELNEWRIQLQKTIAEGGVQRTQCKIFYTATLEKLEEDINQWLGDHPMFYLVTPPVCMPSDHLWGMILFYQEISEVKPRRISPFITPDLEGKEDAV